MKRKLLAMLLVGATLLSLNGCGGARQIQSKDLMKDIEPSHTQVQQKDDEPGDTQTPSSDVEPGDTQTPSNDVEPSYAQVNTDDQNKVLNFSVELFKKSMKEEENTLVSPLSVMMALSMTANGAKNNTLAQMEEVFGMDMETLNPYLYNYVNTLPQGKDYKLNLANSIWIKDDESFTVNEDFLKTNKTYYDASIYKTPFDDTTLQDINLWVDKNTDGMINKILNEIPDGAVMYLINALAFDAKWDEVYKESQIHERTFTTEDGIEQTVDLMYSEESIYLEDENTTGFIKYYKDRKYAFVALLPQEDMSVADYVNEMSGEKISALLNHTQNVQVNAAIPCFETACDITMNDLLKDMGMQDAFDGSMADFSGIGESSYGNLYINRVLHKTYISVDAKGTKAAAVTSVEVECESAPMEEIKTVYLDRPFVYMLIDCETNQPFFLGTLMSVE